MKSTENNNESFLILLFWLLSFCGLGIIGWKFFACQEEPMETKVIYVFSTFLAASFLFRWIRKKSSGVKIEKWTREAIEWSDTGVSAVLLAFLIMAFLIQAFKIPSGSMRPTLEIGDHLFVNKFICRRCKGSVRASNMKVLQGKVNCRKCNSHVLRPVRRK